MINIKDKNCLLNISESIEKIEAYTTNIENHEQFYADQIIFDTVLKNFIIIGEMAAKLSESFTNSSVRSIDWYKIKGFRNIIAHNYFGVDAEEVWQIITKNLPELKYQLKQIAEFF